MITGSRSCYDRVIIELASWLLQSDFLNSLPPSRLCGGALLWGIEGGPLGEVSALTDAEQIEFYSCEAVLEMATTNFVQAGLAFGRIRDLQLYRVDYRSFDVYCREKWQYGRDYVDRLIAAAQVFTQLLTFCQHSKPEHESQ